MSSSPLSATHFLSQTRASSSALTTEGFDNSTLHAADYDVDAQTGFMPRSPLQRLTGVHGIWETCLDAAMSRPLQLGNKSDLTKEEATISEAWRSTIRSLPVLSSEGLSQSEFLLRRAHVVLSFLLQIYIHTLPPGAAKSVPVSLSAPIVDISSCLNIKPISTYADTVLWNWQYVADSPAPLSPAEDEYFFSFTMKLPTLSNIRSEFLYTGTPDEEHFYLTSAWIELHGARALSIMRSSLDELFVGDGLARTRITKQLHGLAIVLAECATTMRNVRRKCDPKVFYDQIRPWFNVGSWILEGIDGSPSELRLVGASAAQSSFVPTVDAFLGIPTAHATATFREYMPRHHRAFLEHLREHSSLRDFVLQNAEDTALSRAYNDAIRGLRLFRDAHMEAARVYIIAPARRARAKAEGRLIDTNEDEEFTGSGGTDLLTFLNELRQDTTRSELSISISD